MNWVVNLSLAMRKVQRIDMKADRLPLSLLLLFELLGLRLSRKAVVHYSHVHADPKVV
ncbi:hypothetical protein AXFE_14770 [Acidithrix ferrooxidans]|uniref:Uncharacterized protein n=1 Tax=Acidithrix ferrooxidans TaxID=1280514 RepID=A0A0D8HIF6_9ACTN|nr:hypothetical protein AXFE_14770 [Acidithrix ferrooxidans]